jgi:hypothetical protein
MMSSTATEAIVFKNIGASTAAFALRGGRYAIAANASGAGSMGLQMQGEDGTTFIPVHTAFATVAGFATVDLPPGTYKFVLATFTAVFASICRISS